MFEVALWQRKTDMTTQTMVDGQSVIDAQLELQLRSTIATQALADANSAQAEVTLQLGQMQTAQQMAMNNQFMAAMDKLSARLDEIQHTADDTQSMVDGTHNAVHNVSYQVRDLRNTLGDVQQTTQATLGTMAKVNGTINKMDETKNTVKVILKRPDTVDLEFRTPAPSMLPDVLTKDMPTELLTEFGLGVWLFVHNLAHQFGIEHVECSGGRNPLKAAVVTLNGKEVPETCTACHNAKIAPDDELVIDFTRNMRRR